MGMNEATELKTSKEVFAVIDNITLKSIIEEAPEIHLI